MAKKLEGLVSRVKELGLYRVLCVRFKCRSGQLELHFGNTALACSCKEDE